MKKLCCFRGFNVFALLMLKLTQTIALRTNYVNYIICMMMLLFINTFFCGRVNMNYFNSLSFGGIFAVVVRCAQYIFNGHE